MFKPGEKIFIRTVTYHHVGEVVGVEDGWVKLTNGSWIADSGRFHNALETGELNEVEYAGDYAVNLSTAVDQFPWKHELPTESK